ncbi:uncharacterized protein LOC143373882 [Andrena cerasifolii]|uniref:uncharacterized protein LOC143373882 n=1 Tax=Andrena cerasifolii TaxID=2819439 RepID=UPI0040384478
MQALIPLIATLSVVSGTPLQLLPYAYLSSPFPVYHQFQDTKTGVHAYSYAGGTSAKEEIRDADGVTRGSYSYVDANGILQSVYYVADEHGFRVAATDLPSDDNLNLETAHILVARNAKADEPAGTEEPAKTEELAKTDELAKTAELAKTEEAGKSSRRKRSVPLSSEGPAQTEQKEKSVALDAVLLEKLAPISTSHQSQVQIHKSVHLEPAKTLLNIAQPLLILPGQIPLATSHQSQVQVHGNARIDLDLAKVKPLVTLPSVYPVPTLLSNLVPSYHENRIELHKQLGIEGAKLKDAVKIDPKPLTIVQPALSLPVAPTIIAKDALPVVPVAPLSTAAVTTSISSHGISQIHPSKILKEAVAVPSLIAKESLPTAIEKTVPVLTPLLAKGAVPLLPITPESASLGAATTSVSSHGVSQIHGDSTVNAVRTYLDYIPPLTQLPTVLHEPTYTLG